MRAKLYNLKLWSLISLILVLLITLAPGNQPARAAPEAPIIRRGPQLEITLSRGPQTTTICRNSQADFVFLVSDEDLWIPVPAAHLTLTDLSTGASFQGSTSANGTAGINLSFVESGTAKLKITARKDGYLPDSKEYTYNVIECQWKLRVNWIEEYTLMEGAPPKVGAAFGWEGLITPQTGQAGDPLKQLTSQTVKGSYSFFIRNTWIKPIKITMEPSVGGDYTLLASGSSDGTWVNLHLETMPVIIPDEVKVKLTDLGPNELTINYMPLVPLLPNKGQCLEASHLGDIQLPVMGGVAIFVAKPCFMAVSFKADVTITLTPVEAGGAFLPAQVIFASLGGQP